MRIETPALKDRSVAESAKMFGIFSGGATRELL